MSDDKPQNWMPPLAWLGLMMAGLPLLFYVPTHLLLSWVAEREDPRYGRITSGRKELPDYDIDKHP